MIYRLFLYYINQALRYAKFHTDILKIIERIPDEHVRENYQDSPAKCVGSNPSPAVIQI